MVATNAALALIATTIVVLVLLTLATIYYVGDRMTSRRVVGVVAVVVLALLTLATVYYVPKTLPGNDHGEEHDHEGNEHSAGGRPA